MDDEELRECGQRMIIAHIKFAKLLIAVVNGPCIRIAPTTVALCDVIYASDTVIRKLLSFSFISIKQQFDF